MRSNPDTAVVASSPSACIIAVVSPASCASHKAVCALTTTHAGFARPQALTLCLTDIISSPETVQPGRPLMLDPAGWPVKLTCSTRAAEQPYRGARRLQHELFPLFITCERAVSVPLRAASLPDPCLVRMLA